MNDASRIYLDNNATTALDPRVLKAMYQELHGLPCNPSSVHFFGQKAKAALNNARKEIAAYLEVKPQEIIFTSGGTESINMAIRGILGPKPSGHIVSTDIEHSCVYETVKALQERGCEITFLKTGSWGAPDPAAVRGAISEHTKLIVLSYVNGETGVKTDIEKIAAIAKAEKIPFVVDAVALIGREPVTIPEGVTAMCFGSHKLHGPKGVGFAYVTANQKLIPILTGGDQEYQKRAGTENLEGILGLAKAVQLLKEELPKKSHEMQDLRDHFEKSLIKNLGEIYINGEGPRVVSTSNLFFDGIDGEDLLMHLDLAGVAASHGSACSSGALEPSRVLMNMDLGRKRAKSSLRFSLSRFTTREEIDKAIQIITEIVQKLRKMG